MKRSGAIPDRIMTLLRSRNKAIIQINRSPAGADKRRAEEGGCTEKLENVG
jgi:hypothetical protein